MATPPRENPPTAEILAKHELARRTITQHNTDLAIFDAENLAVLRRFVMDPSPETQRGILEEVDVVDPAHTPEDRLGHLANARGDLARFVIARYGKVRNDYHTFLPSEVEALREWFANGGGE